MSSGTELPKWRRGFELITSNIKGEKTNRKMLLLSCMRLLFTSTAPPFSTPTPFITLISWCMTNSHPNSHSRDFFCFQSFFAAVFIPSRFVIPISGCHWRWWRRRRDRAVQLSETLSGWLLLHGRKVCQFCYTNGMCRLLARMSKPTVCSCSSLLLLLSSLTIHNTTLSCHNSILSYPTYHNPTVCFPTLPCLVLHYPALPYPGSNVDRTPVWTS